MTTVNFQNDRHIEPVERFYHFRKKFQFTLQCGIIGPIGRLNWTVQIITGYSHNSNENVFLPIHWLNIMLRFSRIGLHAMYQAHGV